MIRPRFVVIGTSAGGVDALQQIFERLPRSFNLPLLVVQHLPAHARIDLDLVFGRSCSLHLLEARDKMRIENGHAYFAAPGYHLLVERNGTLSLSQDEPVNFSRPSIDATFEAAADAFGERAAGILLTGASEDGARGLLALHRAKARTLVQDPASAEAPLMPESALRLFTPDLVADLNGISSQLAAWAEGTAS